MGPTYFFNAATILLTKESRQSQIFDFSSASICMLLFLHAPAPDEFDCGLFL